MIIRILAFVFLIFGTASCDYPIFSQEEHIRQGGDNPMVGDGGGGRDY